MPEPTLAERLDRLERFFDENRESLEDDGDRRGADILAVLLTDIQEVRKALEELLERAEGSNIRDPWSAHDFFTGGS